MSNDTMWQGKYLSVRKAGTWEYAERNGHISAAVIVAVDGEGQLLLVEQYRVPLGRTCLELPARPFPLRRPGQLGEGRRSRRLVGSRNPDRAR